MIIKELSIQLKIHQTVHQDPKYEFHNSTSPYKIKTRTQLKSLKEIIKN